jgi:hypothetical protein
MKRGMVIGIIVVLVLMGVAFYLGYLFSIDDGVEPPIDDSGDGDNYVEMNGVKVSTSCDDDGDCTIVNKELNYRSCFPGICERVDYSLDRFVAVNIESFDIYKESELKFRPTNEECGVVTPLCPASNINTNFDAKCINDLCKKIAR